MGMMEIVPLSSRLLVAAHSLVAYLGKMIVPVKLLPFYPYPKSISLFSLEFFPALVLAIGITAVCIVRAKKQKIWLALWGYYVVTLVRCSASCRWGLKRWQTGIPICQVLDHLC